MNHKCLALAIALGATLCASLDPSMPILSRTWATPAAAATPTHVVVVIQENRTPDNLLNGYCAPNGSCISSSFTGYDSLNTPQALAPVGLETVCDPNHAYESNSTPQKGGFVVEYNNGSTYMGQPNNWDNEWFNCTGSLVPASGATTLPNGAFAYVPARETVPYQLMIGNDGLVADMTFEAPAGPSWPAHAFAVAGTSGLIITSTSPFTVLSSNDLVAENPAGGFNNSGCGNLAGQAVTWIDKTVAQPGSETTTGSGNQIGTCLNATTIMDLMRGASPPLSAKTYANANNTYWSVSDMFNSDYSHNGDSSAVSFFHDIGSSSCTLNNLSIITPSNNNSDHAIGGQTTLNVVPNGPNWVAAIVNAVGNSPCWNSTVIVIYWDDWGGWYDHVPALACSGSIMWPLHAAPNFACGFRVPLIAISPYVVGHIVDHTTRTAQCSVLVFIETTFSLGTGGPLGTCDTITPRDDLSGMFNFGGTPNAFIPIPGATPPGGTPDQFVAGPFLYVPPPSMRN